LEYKGRKESGERNGILFSDQHFRESPFFRERLIPRGNWKASLLFSSLLFSSLLFSSLLFSSLLFSPKF
jgi:hypothetical protein